jgi:tetratricopeptide (TPR) repeat protein
MDRFHGMGMVLALLCASASAADAPAKGGKVDLEKRCLAGRNPAGTHWNRKQVAARCALDRAPLHSMEDMARLVQSEQGRATLEKDFAALLKADHDDPRQRDQLFAQFDAFNAGSQAREVAFQWTDKAPDSPYAHTAAGLQFINAAWRVRTTAAWGDVDPRRQGMMEIFAEKARDELERALSINPEISPACKGLIQVGQMTGDDALTRKELARCIAIDPASYRVMLAWAGTVLPQWGGGPEEWEALAQAAAAHEKENPLLGVLRNMPAFNRARTSGDIAELRSAVDLAPDVDLMQLYADRLDDPKAALAWLSQAIRFAPREPRYRYDRAIALGNAGDFAGAMADIDFALAQDASDPQAWYQRGDLQQMQSKWKDARESYRTSLRFDPLSPWASLGECQAYARAEDDAAATAKCTEQLALGYPTWVEALYLRAWWLARKDDPAAVDARERFMQMADLQDPVHRRYFDSLAEQGKQPLVVPTLCERCKRGAH